MRPVLWRFDLSDPADLGPAEEWIAGFGAREGEIHYLNGIVPANQGTCLVVAAQRTGVLWRVDVAERTAVPIDLGGEIVNGDGLLWVGDVLYACDSSEEPNGTVRMCLTALRLAEDLRSG
jgi:hypothetical protein